MLNCCLIKVQRLAPLELPRVGFHRSRCRIILLISDKNPIPRLFGSEHQATIRTIRTTKTLTISALFVSVTHTEIAGGESVIDSDTIDIHGQRLLLHDLDPPEKDQPCYDACGQAYWCGTIGARSHEEFISASPVNYHKRTPERYDRTVADCSVRGANIEEWILGNGHALTYRRYSSGYFGAEQETMNNITASGTTPSDRL
jgi:endonuclease YncB( thermonuclease family)